MEFDLLQSSISVQLPGGEVFISGNAKEVQPTKLG